MLKKYQEKIRDELRNTYDSIADQFDKTRKNSWPEFNDFLRYIPHGGKVLDAGCGTGRLYRFLMQKSVDYIGIDNSSVQIELARRNFPEARFETADIAQLFFPDDHFDTILAIASFHHLPGKRLRAQAVSEMYRVLRPGGKLIVTAWNLFQPKHWLEWVKSFTSFFLTFGFRHSWNDLRIPWAEAPQKRYYHAFLPSELKRCFPSGDWNRVEFYFTRKESRVKFFQSFNICLILEKKNVQSN